MIENWYNKIDTIQLPIGEGGWMDADHRIFEACFLILGQFVEGELGKIDNEDDEEDCSYRGYRLHSEGENDKKAIDLWIWYKDELEIIKKDVSLDIKLQFVNVPKDNSNTLGYMTLIGYKRKYGNNYINELCDKKLDELMIIRRTLWT